MSQEILNTSNIYQSICMASITGRERGLSVKELKKTFHLKNRDIKSLISFLDSGYNAGSDPCFYFEVYRLTSRYTAQKDNLPYSCLDIEDTEDVNLEEDDIKDTMYIRIQDSVMILKERLKESDIDLTNASLLHSIQDEMRPVWNKISDFHMDSDYIVIREEKSDSYFDIKRKKSDWVTAVVKGMMVSLEQKDSSQKGKKENVLPLGMYYNSFLDAYICVYRDGQSREQRIMLNEISKITAREEYQTGIRFSIDDYIKKAQTKKMAIRVYKEGNVAKKLKKLLEENQLKVESGEEYDIFTFFTEDVRQYNKALKSYGRSVIVLEPEEIRGEMVRNTKEALQYYENLPHILSGEEPA